MIRVLHILHSMNRGGAENAIMNYYRHIDREQVQFDFLLTAPDKCQFEDEIAELGGRIYRVPLLTMSRPWRYVKAVNRFFKQHPEYKIVHSHTSSKSAIPLAIAKHNHIPVRIAHSHNNRSENGYRGTVRNLLKIPLLSVATNLFACSEEAAIWLYGHSTTRSKKVQILPNVIESERFSFAPATREEIRKRLKIDSQTCLIGCTARFSKQKNIPFAIEVFSNFVKLYPDSKFILIGDGELRHSIMSCIDRLNVKDKIIMTGVVPNVNDYLQAMDLFLMTSHFEGLCIALVEAQTSGLRCFTSTGVSQEADKTGLVTYLPLGKGAEFWAQYIYDHMNYERHSHIDDIRDAGYDAETSAIKLQEFYLNTIHNYAED